MGGKPRTDLCGRVRVGDDTSYIGQRRPSPPVQAELHAEEHLAGDDERLAGREVVERRGDAALDGVLDRYEPGTYGPVAHRVQRRRDRREGRRLLAELQRQQRLVRERPLRAEVSEHPLRLSAWGTHGR